MDKKFVAGKEYGVVDAFRSFFLMLIIVNLVSDVLLGILSLCMGKSVLELTEIDYIVIIANVVSSLTFIVFYIVYNRIVKVRHKYVFSDGQKISLLPISIAIVLAIICIFLFTPFMNLVQFFFESLGYNPDNTLPMQELMSDSVGYFALGILVYALLPAIGEELFFRGIILKSLSTRYNGFVTIVMSSVLFSLMHGSLQQTVYQFIVGLMLGYLAFVGGSVLYSIILHFINNLLVVLFTCFDIVGYLNSENTIYYNVFSMIFPFLLFILGVILVAILFWVLKYLRNKNFFRYETKSQRKKRLSNEAKNPVEVTIGFKGMFKNFSYKEKVFFLASMGLGILIWLIYTFANFV